MVNCPSQHRMSHGFEERERIKQKLYHMAFSKNLRKKNQAHTQKGKTGLLLII